jgi:tagatose 1,6-diphosphate aldolase
MTAFSFETFDGFSDGAIDVRVEEHSPADEERGFVPAYECGIYLAGSDTRVGHIGLRVGSTPWIETYAGHLGYDIEPAHRGHRYAARACRLLVPIARHHGLSTLWITVTPDNAASRRTCEILGATYVETVDLPPDCDMYAVGERQKCRYRWDL